MASATKPYPLPGVATAVIAEATGLSTVEIEELQVREGQALNFPISTCTRASQRSLPSWPAWPFTQE